MKLTIIIVLILIKSIQSSTKLPNKSLNLDLINLILTERVDEIKNLLNVDKAITQSMWVFPKLQLKEYEKQMIWDAFVGKRRAETLQADELNVVLDFLPAASDTHLFSFNVSDIDIIKVLGKVDHFVRRQAGIISHGIKKLMNSKKILNNSTFVNLLGGLLCGFSSEEVKLIGDEEFRKIDTAVFMNMNACTLHQYRILYGIAKRPTVYGEPQCWTFKELERIGMIAYILTEEEFSSIPPAAMKGLHPKVMLRLRFKVLNEMTSKQFHGLSKQTKLAFHERYGVISSANSIIMNRILLIALVANLSYLLLVS